ncbi:hypothetical protein JNB71_20535 [Rhizobium herbae]|uniref:Uncharacterized protein n=1 Tax=Rhizobium herbae TaxID=508661 RepID=A0ABS7HEJ1_9HYPH|nr:hypothetical protein [Rhizobium herbae]MBW9065696.1 hypothetical protein [Rhizobium herbae]
MTTRDGNVSGNTALYIAVERFDPSKGSQWRDYIVWSGLTQLDEVVSLDGMLCPVILKETKASYWNHIVNEDGMLNFFTDLDFLKQQLGSQANLNILAVLRNPSEEAVLQGLGDRFRFLGYDLLDQDQGVSALTNCGGFPDVFANAELSTKGLLQSHGRAREVQCGLKERYPQEYHADCNIWAIFRLEAA